MTTDEPVQGDAKLPGNPEPYTPTTEDVREAYEYGARILPPFYDPTHAAVVTECNAEFRRWLAAHDAEVIERARDAMKPPYNFEFNVDGTEDRARTEYVGVMHEVWQTLTNHAARIRCGEGEL